MTDVRTGEITRTILIDRRAVEATFWEEAGGRFRVSSAGLPTLLVERNIDAPIEDHWAYSCSASGAAHVGDWEFGKTPSAAFAAGVRGFWRPVRL